MPTVKKFKQNCYAVIQDGQKILIIDKEKMALDYTESEEEFSSDDLLYKSQEVAQFNEAQKKVVLSFLPTSQKRLPGEPIPGEFRKNETAEFKAWHPHIIEQKYVV